MTPMTRLAPALAALGLITGAATASAADLPASTKAILAETKLPESILSGLDKELEVPAAWMDEAKARKKLSIVSTWDNNQFRKMVAPFKERYPFLDITYARSSYNQRVVRTLIAWKEGRRLTDIITGFGGGYFLFKEADALEDMRDIPGFRNNVPANMRDAEGNWVGQRLRYWCMSYNTNMVKKADLPKTWEDLLTNAAWHGNKIGLVNRPQLWLLMLWGDKGADWTKRYMKDFLEKTKPQMRKEGTNAIVALTVAGEFQASLPSAAYRTKQYLDKGAPISWHCPEPVPLAVSEMGIVKGTPNTAAAKIFTNWFLSKEGQIAQYAADQAPPVHKDLQTREFLAFPDEIIGKKIAFRGPEAEEVTKEVFANWDALWKANAGEDKTKLFKVTAKLDAVKQRGRTISFKREGKTQELEVSGSRTKLTIAGKKESRSKLKAGMTCEIEGPENGPEATVVTCK
jgi:iron(III) transport system substrate-binding protein